MTGRTSTFIPFLPQYQLWILASLFVVLLGRSAEWEIPTALLFGNVSETVAIASDQPDASNFSVWTEAEDLKPFYPQFYWAIPIATKGVFFVFILFLIGVIGVGLNVLKKLLGKAFSFDPGLSLTSSFRHAHSYDTGLLQQLICSLIILLICVLNHLVFQASYDPGQGHFQAIQLFMGKGVVVLFTVQFLLVVGFRFEEAKQTLRRFLFAKGQPYSLAIIRILLSVFVLGMFVDAYFRLEFWAHLPVSERVALPYMGWFISHVPITPEIYKACCVLGAVFAVLAGLGLWTRTSLILVVVTYFYVYGVPNFYGKLLHNHVFLWFFMILAVSPCAEVWSIDRLFRKKGETDVEETKVSYLLPIKLIWLVMGLIYLPAGIYKFWDSGMEWVLGDNMVWQMQLEWIQHYDQVPALRLDKYPALAKSFGLGVIVFEFYYLFLLFSRRALPLAALGGLSLHWAAGYFMYIPFYQLQQSYLVFINWNWLRAKLKKKPLPAEDLAIDTKANVKQIFSKIGSENRRILAVGCLLIFANAICGFGSIHSWPFSSYPSYSAMAKGTTNEVLWQPVDAQGNRLDAGALGIKANFKKESFTIFEDNISALARSDSKAELIQEIEAYWEIWQLNVPALQTAKKVEVYLITTSVDPDKRTEELDRIHLHSFQNSSILP